MTQGERPKVAAAHIYVLGGKLTDEELDKIRGYLINPVDSREASAAKPETLEANYAIPTEVDTVEGFISMDAAALEQMRTSLGLAMELDDLQFLQSYFAGEEKRDPTITEVRMIDTYWSDHCRHTTFLTEIDESTIDDQMVLDAYNRYLAGRVEVYGEEKAAKRPVTLMDIGTIAGKVLKKRGCLPNLDESEEINACSIRINATVDGKKEPWRRNSRPAVRQKLCISGNARDRCRRSNGSAERDAGAQAAAAQAVHHCRCRLFFLRQPDRSGYRIGS